MVGGFNLTVDADNNIYAASDDRQVFCIDPNGSELSRFEAHDGLSWPVIGPDQTIYIADANALYALASSPCDGKPSVLHRPADLNFDNVVNFADIALFAGDWLLTTDSPSYPLVSPPVPSDYTYTSGPIYPAGDLDRNGYVNFKDIVIISNNWLKGFQDFYEQ
jgi:hypothetical protein